MRGLLGLRMHAKTKQTPCFEPIAPKFKTKNMVQAGVSYPIRTLVLSHGSRRRHRSWGFGRTGRAQLQLATAPQGRTPVLGVSGSGHMGRDTFKHPAACRE